MKSRISKSMATICLLLGSLMFVQAQTGKALFEGYPLADEGAWCWFADPRALHYENGEGTINSSYIGYIDVHGAIKAVQYDFLKKRRSEVMVRSYFQPDDHDNPTFLVLPDERVMVFYSRHTDEPCFYYRITKVAGDLTTLGEEKVLPTADNTTYPSPFILSDDPEHIYLCWRGIRWHPTIARLTLPDENDDVTIDWGPYQMVQSSGARPYAKYQSNGKDKIMMTYTTGHPDNENPNWLYFNHININTLQLEDVEGNVLSTIADGPHRVTRQNPYAEAHPKAVVDRTPGWRDWVWQVASDDEGRPVIAMVRISGDKKTHDYYHVRWDGNEWKAIFLAHAGGHFHQSPDIEHCYSGGMAIDPEQTDVIYCSVPQEGAFGKVYELVRYQVDTATGAVTATPVTRHSRKNNVRPYVLPGSGASPLRLTWMYGDYYDWIVSAQRPGYPTAIHADWQLPEEEVRFDKDCLAEQIVAASGEMTTPKWSGAGKKSDFTLTLTIRTGGTYPHGELVKVGKWTVSCDSVSGKLQIAAGKQRFAGSNVMASADNWSRYGRATNGRWYPVRPYDTFELTLVSEEGRTTCYVNGKVELTVMEKCPLKKVTVGGSTAEIIAGRLYGRALHDAEIGSLASSSR